MPTECSAKPMGLARVDGRAVVADFEGGAITSNAGGLLLGATDRAIGLGASALRRCFADSRDAGSGWGSTRWRRWCGAAGVRHRARLRGPGRARPAAPRPGARGGARPARGAAPAAARRSPARARSTGSSTVPRKPTATAGSPTTARRSRRCSWTSSSTRTRRAPKEIVLDLDATDDPLHGHQEGRFFHGYYDCYCYRVGGRCRQEAGEELRLAARARAADAGEIGAGIELPGCGRSPLVGRLELDKSDGRHRKTECADGCAGKQRGPHLSLLDPRSKDAPRSRGSDKRRASPAYHTGGRQATRPGKNRNPAGGAGLGPACGQAEIT